MARTVGIGEQDFARIITEDMFYIDKTQFIKEWWESKDSVTLITRPRRFGKTLNLNMLDYFFSNKHANRSDLFENLSIWQEEKYRNLQGTYPVISLSFANIKEPDYLQTKQKITQQKSIHVLALTCMLLIFLLSDFGNKSYFFVNL